MVVAHCLRALLCPFDTGGDRPMTAPMSEGRLYKWICGCVIGEQGPCRDPWTASDYQRNEAWVWEHALTVLRRLWGLMIDPRY